jgi:hypothetical protein
MLKNSRSRVNLHRDKTNKQTSLLQQEKNYSRTMFYSVKWWLNTHRYNSNKHASLLHQGIYYNH